MIQRFSSRRHRLDASFLNPRLAGAKQYDRIAGYFSSSILEVAGEALAGVEGTVRIICNSDLDPADVISAQAAQAAIRREWCAAQPEALGDGAKPRLANLHGFLASGKLQVRVLPNKYFGLIHGKAGVITLADGRKTCFMGSANESKSAWQLNYEIVWEDDSEEAIQWVQEEFDALWGSPFAVPLADFVIDDVARLAERTVLESVQDWRNAPTPASPIIESPVYRKEVGLWEHQKYFVEMVFRAHRSPHGARFVLADQVGLGKTLQLAMSAQLMALTGDRPVLVLAPRPLVWQWQDELANLLDMPSAVWDGKQWVDENGIEHPAAGPEAIRKCPRRVGIVSTGLVTSKSEICDYLLAMKYECVVTDESHRARRKNIVKGQEFERSDPNNLLEFLQRISPQTRSMLLATATPIQLHPVEAWDLLDVLARGSDAVLGTYGSPWRNARRAVEMSMGTLELPTDELEMWEWIRNPLPPAAEGNDFKIIRTTLGLSDSDAFCPGNRFDDLGATGKGRMRRGFKKFVEQHNPFIRHIVLRTRDYLETTINPETGEPFLKPVRVQLHGESEEDAISLPAFLEDAYHRAEEFCKLLAKRMNSGFLKTLLLRRVGSTIESGRITAERMLVNWADIEDEDYDDEEGAPPKDSSGKSLTPTERAALERFVTALKANQARDPKYAVVVSLLKERGWLEKGCIVFSQFFDSVWWLANQLSADLPGEEIGIYAGAAKSGLMKDKVFTRCLRDDIKAKVKNGTLRLVLGTDAASEGLNLQRLGCLINLDLPWNPTRLEQRKGRIQRIGQLLDVVDVYNMRYAGSVEDRVHLVLSERLEDISKMFGQIPDVLEDAWIEAALGEIDQAKKIIDAVPASHPFALKYHKIDKVDWETCSAVLDNRERTAYLATGW
jgi:hypothetical protein